MADVSSVNAAVNPALGVLLHAIGGLAAASFYLPLKFVKKWSWETFWITQGFASWILAPLIGAWLTVPNFIAVLQQSPSSNMIWCYVLGVLWGVGGLTFGLSMRYLGMSLGYSVALGFCAMFGTIVPQVVDGNGQAYFTIPSQMIILIGLIVALIGIAMCGIAGAMKEADASKEEIRKAIKEFALTKGIIVAVFAGVMSACMGIATNSGFAGLGIDAVAISMKCSALFVKNVAFVVILLGGFTSNLIWCLILLIKNKSIKDFTRGSFKTVFPNYLLCLAGGTTWYLQFFFYGMGATRMSGFSYASWTIHMAFIIAFSNLWGILLGEWKGTKSLTRFAVGFGIVVLLYSTVVVGVGYKVENQEKPAADAKAKAEASAQLAPVIPLANRVVAVQR